MDMPKYEALKKIVHTPYGRIAYAEAGEGPAALFIHGVFMNGALWRNAIEELRSQRRCIALDLPGHGATRASLGQDPSLEAHADMVAAFLDALGIDKVDVVGNDTGGAISQLFAVRHTDRVRTLTLTNCDAHDNVPPDAFKPQVELAKAGELTPFVAQVSDDLELARAQFAVGFEHPEDLSGEVIRGYLGPFKDVDLAREVERRIASVRGDELVSVEEQLRALNVPTLIVWGTDDEFFETSWAYWLRDLIPGATEVVEIEGGKLFFVDERASELVPHLRKHWAAHEPVSV